MITVEGMGFWAPTMFAVLCCPNVGKGQGLRVMGSQLKIGFCVLGEGSGSHKLTLCKGLVGPKLLTRAILRVWSTYADAVRGSSWGL